MRRFLVSCYNHALDSLFPPQCLRCASILSRHGALCAECWNAIVFIQDPCCARCGLPFEYSLGGDALCAGCIRLQPVFTQARAVLRYDEESRALMLKLKYRDDTALAPTLGSWMARAGAEMLARSQWIVPVPLHYRRHVTRRYNQSALLARAVARQCNIPVSETLLMRTRNTAPQTGLTQRQRQDNVKQAFAVPSRAEPELKGKTITLVDDVMTTGATLSACSHALLNAGAREVNVLTLARRV